ncbi:MAG: glycosyl hydrolase family 18 protein [bacterium]|nr:glycosyl hydrolase family 18 protein [bacterium]
MKINKNLLIIILVFFIGYFFINFNVENKVIVKDSVKNKTSQITKTDEKPYVGKIFNSLFVPYWSLESDFNSNSYDRVIYFGISTNESGVNKEEVGYKNLEKFSSLNFINSKKYLTLRMTNTDDNLKILKDEKIIKKIIAESINIAKQNNFSGIVLDLELGVLFGDEIIDQINNFSNSFYKEIIKNNLKYSIAIYGDVFYRKRPYDVSSLAKNSDEIMIMAYDFHKNIGEPGPNFPSEYFDEFINKIPSNKLTIIFGMYGYDWIVDDKDRPIKPAQSLTLNQIKSKYSNYCNEERCEFVDENKRRHIIWYENEESVSKKIKYLKTRGVGNFAYWAAGYF